MFLNSIIIFLIIINIIGFITVAIDKRKAQKHLWRIPEKTLFLIAVLGGCPGVYTGMLVFRHKTKHYRFTLGVPVIFILQVLLVYYLFSDF
jgi:uncharacterized membrane protein YsdA (DUF1294 family)